MALEKDTTAHESCGEMPKVRLVLLELSKLNRKPSIDFVNRSWTCTSLHVAGSGYYINHIAVDLTYQTLFLNFRKINAKG